MAPSVPLTSDIGSTLYILLHAMHCAYQHQSLMPLYKYQLTLFFYFALYFSCRTMYFNSCEGLEILPNGISILTDQFNRTTGDAFVQFASMELVSLALQKHKEMIGHRFVD